MGVEVADVDLFTSLQDDIFGLYEAYDEHRDLLVPLPEQIYVDWEYMFCVRKVMEVNLREVVGARADEILKPLIEFDCLRPCSAPRTRMMPNNITGMKGGWDWAGVEGVWRRCICWMDYRDLIRKYLTMRRVYSFN
jgi:hypothetical protein